MTKSFADLGVPARLVGVLERRGIKAPFRIQAETLPDSLNGRDLCGRAPTGSGKTLAFAIPIALHDVPARPFRPSSLVLVPTRELAEQVRRELEPLSGAYDRRVISVYGGVGYGAQRQALRKGVHTLVACPGRLEDLLANNDVDLSCVGLAVIDEADRMADMGFLPAVKRLLDQTRPDRQTLLFSATLDNDVDVLVRRYQHDPVRHETVPDDADLGKVHHLFWRVQRAERVDVIRDVVSLQRNSLVFCRTKHGADRLTRQLKQHGLRAAAIHGNRSQPQRQRALNAFTNGSVQVLVATDVAARGIHVDDIGCVVHFDPPGDSKDYVHRSGRTGRAGADGTSICLVLDDQQKAVRKMQRTLGLRQGFERPDATSVFVPLVPLVPKPNQSQRDGSTPQGRPGATKSSKRRPKRRRQSTSGNGKPGKRGSGEKHVRH